MGGIDVWIMDDAEYPDYMDKAAIFGIVDQDGNIPEEFQELFDEIVKQVDFYRENNDEESRKNITGDNFLSGNWSDLVKELGGIQDKAEADYKANNGKEFVDYKNNLEVSGYIPLDYYLENKDFILENKDKIKEKYGRKLLGANNKEVISIPTESFKKFVNENKNLATTQEKKDILTKAAGGATAEEKDATATELNKRMAEMRGKGTAEDPNQPYVKKDANGNLIENTPEEIQKAQAEAKSYVGKKGNAGELTVISAEGFADANEQDAIDSIPEGKIVNDAGELVDDPNYVPPADSVATDTITPQTVVAPTDSLPTDSTVVNPVTPVDNAPVDNAPVAPNPKQEGNKSLLNIDNLKLGYVGAEDKNGRPVGKAKLVSEKEKRDFVKKLKSISDKYPGLDSEDFLNIMLKENSLYNGDVLLLDQKSGATTNDKGGRARGLIQFIPSTAKGLGLNQEDLATMSPADQLDYVDKFYQGAPKDSLKSYGDMYTYTFQPAAMGKGDDYVIGDNKGDAAAKQRYESNKALDKDKDGKITKGEFSDYAQKNIPSDTIPNLFSKVTPEQYEENNKKIAADTFVEDTKPVGVDTPFTPLGFQESELNPNLRKDEKGKLIGGDKYVTKITDPNGVTKEIFTDNPLQERNILGETFYSEKGGNRIFKLTDEYEKGNYVFKDYETTTEFNKDFDSKRPYKTINGTPGKGGVEDFKTADERMNHITTTAFEKVLDDRLEGLTQKAKTEGGLSQKEFQEAKKAYDLKEGFYEKRQEDWAERVDQYSTGTKLQYKYKDKKRKNHIENDKFKNDFAKNVLFPEAEKRMNAAEALQDEALQEAEIAFSNGEITKEQFNVAKKTNKAWHNENDPIIRTMGAYRYNMDHDKSAASKDNPFFTYKDTNGNPSSAVKGRSIAGGDLAMGNIDWIEKEILGKYEPVLSEEEKAEAIAKDDPTADPAKNKVDKSTSGNNAGNNNAGGNNAGGANLPANNVNPEADEVDKSGMVGEDAKTNPETAAYLDEDYLLKQNKLDQETIDFIKGQKEFNAELPEEEADYSNLLGNITDISKGIIGIAGATEEVPEYETGDMYNQSVNDLTRMKDQGLSKQELDYATGNAKKAFEFGMAQYRGTGAAGALVGAGQQAAILQDQYGKIAAQDRGVRRQNMQNFVAGAVRDEAINREKFQDKFTQTMLNKKEGAALARDAYTNMNERAQFEKQYGKNSQYSKLMNEQMLSLRENREYAKQSRANTKQQSVDNLQRSILERQAKIDKNKATG